MLTLIVLTSVYFLPTWIASQRGHAVGGIVVLNLFFGWTGVGWMALLLWALLSSPPFNFLVRPAYRPYGRWRRY